LLERLRNGLRTWRRLGAIPGALAVTRLLGRAAALGMRGAWLKRRPLRVRPGELHTALGGMTAAEALRGPALRALPTVGAFECALACIEGEQREELLRRADASAAHIFDLLGSGPTELGPKIDWQRDFKTGRSWPLRHRSRVTISYPDGSDIKVPWELSRFQHLPLLAGAFRLTHDRRYLEEIGMQLQDWIEANPTEFGANWACTMDVAIRAANWVATLVLVSDEDGAASMPWLEEALASLLLHGRFIRSHLEWAQTRGNHYLSDVVGLLAVAAVFSEGEEGRAWVEWAVQETVGELVHQIREDGCDHEASIPYHRLVAELFICGLQAANALVPGSVPPWADERLDLMLNFTAAYTRPDGLAPQIGDADDGRFLPLGDYGALEHRRHDHLFAQAVRQPPAQAGGHTAFPDGGWFVMRSGGLHAVVRCGDVGIGGVGCHAHCDQLAFELCYGEQPLVVDPGAYLYTADLTARAAFRATAAHATLEIGEAEQNPIYVERPFRLDDYTRAELLEWKTDGAGATFIGLHHGYERLEPSTTHERRIDFDGDALAVTVTDTIRSEGSHSLRWSLPLAPGEVEINDGMATVHFPSGVHLHVQARGLNLAYTKDWYSPSYGVRYPVPVLRAQRKGQPGEDRAILTLQVAPPHRRVERT
jgi:Heparinase II/III-like protein/Heparinase II/III N-terminus